MCPYILYVPIGILVIWHFFLLAVYTVGSTGVLHLTAWIMESCPRSWAFHMFFCWPNDGSSFHKKNLASCALDLIEHILMYVYIYTPAFTLHYIHRYAIGIERSIIYLTCHRVVWLWLVLRIFSLHFKQNWEHYVSWIQKEIKSLT